MNKRELLRQLADDTGLEVQQVKVVLDSMIHTVTELICCNDRLVLQRFGVFLPVMQTERPGRNPKTGEPKTIHSRRTVKFRPGSALIKAINDNEKEERV